MTTIKLRRGTAAAWTARNTILADGEKGVEKDTFREKNGDGVTAWNDLPYLDDHVLVVTAGSGYNVVSSGADLTGANDSFAAINAASAFGIKDLYFPKGTYLLSAKVTVPSGARWTLHPGAVLKPSTDHDVLQISVGAKVRGGQIDCSALAAFTSNAVLFTGQISGGTQTTLADMTIRGKSIAAGAAIKLTCPVTGNYIDWVTVKNCYLDTFNKLVWLDGNVTGTWINANSFTDLTFGAATNCLYVDGDGTHTNNADGNKFSFNGQAYAGGARVIYNTGSNNEFDGFVYDVGGSGLTPIHAEIFPTATGTRIRTIQSAHDKIIDNGFYTDVVGRNYAKQTHQVFEPVAAYTRPASGSVPVGIKLMGNQDDWLANSYLRHTSGITQTQGDALFSGSLNNITNPDPSTVATWRQASGRPDIIWQIDLTAETVTWPRVMGLVFEYALRPKTIEVTLTDTVLGDVVVFTTTTNDSDIVTFLTNAYGLITVNKIKIRFAVPKDPTNGDIRLTRLWLSSGNQVGKAWLPLTGGSVLGNLSVPAFNYIRTGRTITGSRLSAATVGNGGLMFDTTIGKGIDSDGTNWKERGYVLYGSAALDFPSIAAAGQQELTLTVTGAVVGDTVVLGPPATLEAGLQATGYVSATNTVKVRLSNVTASPIDPASATWKATVVR